MTASKSHRIRLTWRGKLIVVLSMVPIALVLAELGARVHAMSEGRATSPAALREEILQTASGLVDDLPGAARLEQLEARAKSRMEPHPFAGWETADLEKTTRKLLQGYQEGELRKSYVVVIMGGSVSGIFASSKGGGGEFERLLEADPRFEGTDVVVFNQGRGAWKQPQQLGQFGYLFVRGVEPDLLINLDGFNEVALANQNRSLGGDSLYPAMPQWNQLHALRADPRIREFRERASEIRFEGVYIAKRGSSGLRPYSLLWTELTLRELHGLMRESASVGEIIMGPKPEGKGAGFFWGQRLAPDSMTAIKEGVESWSRASIALNAVCATRGLDYFHVLQPTLHDRGAKIVTEEERRRGRIAVTWGEAVDLGYPMLRAKSAELKDAGVNFYDASRVFEGHDETLYYDSCHFGAAGNLILARAMAEAFLGQLPPGPAKRER